MKIKDRQLSKNFLLARSAELTWERSALQTLEAYRLAMQLPA